MAMFGYKSFTFIKESELKCSLGFYYLVTYWLKLTKTTVKHGSDFPSPYPNDLSTPVLVIGE